VFYTSVSEIDTEYSSHEVTFTSDTDSGIEWVAGAYYYRDNVNQPFSLRAPTNARFDTSLTLPTFTPVQDNPIRAFYYQRGRLISESYAGFGQITFPLGSTWKLTTGARYSHDQKDGEEQLQYHAWNPFGPGRDAAGNPNSWATVQWTSETCCTIAPLSITRNPPLTHTWSGVSGRVALDWQPSEDAMYYASLSRGYKSGGYQLGQVAADPIVDNENVWAYEIGAKLTLADRLQLNTSVFYYDYEDLQIPVSVIREGIQNAVYDNIPEAETYGAEIEAIWAATERLQLNLSYGYLHSTFGEYKNVFDIFAVSATNPSPTTDLSGGFIPQSPQHKGNVTAIYTLDFASSSLSLLGSYSYVGEQYFSIFNVEKLRGEPYGVTDFRAVWEPSSHRYTVIGFVRNATEEYYATSAIVGPATVGSPRGITAGAPRTYGMELHYRF
jgi:iron complex outermembrane receptor protein